MTTPDAQARVSAPSAARSRWIVTAGIVALGAGLLLAAAATASDGPTILDMGPANVPRLVVPLRLPSVVFAIGAIALVAVAVARCAAPLRVAPRPVLIVIVITLSGLAIAVLVALLHLQGPVPIHTRNGWLFFRSAAFSDLADTRSWPTLEHPYSLHAVQVPGLPVRGGLFVPPAGLVVADAMARVTFPAELTLFAVPVLGCVVGAALAASAGCRRAVQLGLVAAFLLSYGTQFALERANFEAFGLLFLVPATLLAEAGFSGIGGALVGCLVSLKLTSGPLLLGAGPRRWRWLAAGAGALLVCHLAGSVAEGLDPVSSVSAVVRNADQVATRVYNPRMYTNPNTNVQFSTSIDTLVVSSAAFTAGREGADAVRPVVEASEFVAAKLILMILALLWAFFFDETFWRRSAIVTCCYLLAPSVSWDYKLLLLLVPLMLLLRHGPRGRAERIAVALFALALVPKAYWYLADTPTSTSCVLTPLLVAAILALSILAGVADRRAGPPEPGDLGTMPSRVATTV